MNKDAILIEVTIHDPDTGDVRQQIVKTYNGSFGWEIEELFSVLGRRVARIVDPSMDETS